MNHTYFKDHPAYDVAREVIDVLKENEVKIYEVLVVDVSSIEVKLPFDTIICHPLSIFHFGTTLKVPDLSVIRPFINRRFPSLLGRSLNEVGLN